MRVIRDATCEFHLNGIATEMAKTAVSIYISELLSHSVSAQMADKNLYDFIEESVLKLDRASESVAGFPLVFTIELSRFLGFDPHNNFSNENSYFDMENGNFCPLPPGHPYYLSLPLSSSLSEVISTLDSGINHINVSRTVRNELLSALLLYFRIHIPAFGELKSVQVLSEVLND